MVHWSGKGKDSSKQKRERRRIPREVVERERVRRRLQAIKDRLDLYGEDSLDLEQKEIVRLFHDYFYPDQG